MKKLLLPAITMICVLCMGFQCERHSVPIVNRGVWRVKNATDQKLSLNSSFLDNRNPVEPELEAGEEVTLFSHDFLIYRMPEFGTLLSRWGDWGSENIHFSVVSASGDTLARWTYADVAPVEEGGEGEAEDAGKHFFTERSWSRTLSDGQRDDEMDVVWVFTIEQSDLSQPATEQGGAARADLNGIRQ